MESNTKKVSAQLWLGHPPCHLSTSPSGQLTSGVTRKCGQRGMPPWLGVCSPSQLLGGTQLLHSWTCLVCSSIRWDSQYQEKAGASPTCCRGTGDRILEGHLACCCPPRLPASCVRMTWRPRAQRGTATLHNPLRTLVRAHGPFLGTWHVPHGGALQWAHDRALGSLCAVRESGSPPTEWPWLRARLMAQPRAGTSTPRWNSLVSPLSYY